MSYVNQTFSVGQVLTAAQVQQLNDNARDHIHGQSGVSDYVYAKTEIRQAIQAALLDSNGRNACMTAGTGLRLTVTAAGTPLVMSAAGGYDAYGGPSETVERYASTTADIIGADVSASNTSYIYRDLASAFGANLVPPQYGYYFDTTKHAILNLEGTNGSTSMIDDFGNTWAVTGTAAISTAQFKFGASCLSTPASGDLISSSSFTSLGDGSWQIETWFRIATIPAAGQTATLFKAVNGGGFGAQMNLNNTAGTVKLSLSLSSNGSSNDIASASLGANTTYTTNQWNKVRLVFDALAGTYKAYLSLNAAAETADISVSSSSKICAVTSLQIGGMTAASVMFFDAFRFLPAALNTSTETPAAAAPSVTSYAVDWFSIGEMKMWNVTSASAAAGTLPGMTAKTRVYIGQVDSTGAAFATIRNYAIKGRYVGTWAVTLPALGSTTSINHNLGIKPRHVNFFIECVTAESGFVPGDRLNSEMLMANNSTPVYAPNGMPNNSISASWVTGGTNAYRTYNPSTQATALLTVGNWKYRFEVERGW